MTADLVARLEKAAAHPLLHESDARLFREAASALRSSGEAKPVAYIETVEHPPGSEFEAEVNLWLLPPGIKPPAGTQPLYLHPATPASAWRPIAEGWALVFSDPRDFCASASALIGATYSDPDAAAQRFANKSLRGEGMVWGDILAFAPTPPTSTQEG